MLLNGVDSSASSGEAISVSTEEHLHARLAHMTLWESSWESQGLLERKLLCHWMKDCWCQRNEWSCGYIRLTQRDTQQEAFKLEREGFVGYCTARECCFRHTVEGFHPAHSQGPKNTFLKLQMLGNLWKWLNPILRNYLSEYLQQTAQVRLIMCVTSHKIDQQKYENATWNCCIMILAPKAPFVWVPRQHSTVP